MEEVLAFPYSKFRVLERWVRDDMNNPSRTDHYIMQLTQILHGVNSKRSLDVSEFKLKFESAKRPKPMTQEQKNRAIEIAKSRWKVRIGVKDEKNA